MMKITLLIGALAVAKATVPDAVEACFVENGVSWNNHGPETAEQCLEHCDLMCGACKEITLENAADPGVLGALPEPPNGYGGILDCLCSQKAAVAAAESAAAGGGRLAELRRMVKRERAAAEASPRRACGRWRRRRRRWSRPRRCSRRAARRARGPPGFARR